MALKSIRLPETEIANLAFKSYDFKVAFLANWLRPKQIKGSYEPLRRSIGEAANVMLPLLPDLQATSLEQLEKLVERECKGNSDYIAMNMAPVRAIRSFIAENSATTFYLEELPITLFPGMRYAFWAPMLVRYGQETRIVFLDLRRTGGLSDTGCAVCFSVMHERFRVLNPDYADVKLEVWKFANTENRQIRVVEEWCDPLSFGDVTAEIADTYAVLTALRRGDGGRATGTDHGPLFR